MQTGGEQARRFPLGAAVTAEALAEDPYPIYAQLRQHEPVSWIGALGMYLVVSHTQVERILMDPHRFTVGTEHSLLTDTFGETLLTVEDPLHARYRAPFAPTFMPAALRAHMESGIRVEVDRLIDGFAAAGTAELRRAFAARLPILTMLTLFGLPPECEADLRRWYDSFEQALGNFQRQESIRTVARGNVAQFLLLIDQHVERYRVVPDERALLSVLANAPVDVRLSNEAIGRNLLVVLFGGISTIEALILNAFHALSLQPGTLERVRADSGLIPAVVDETIRWAGPVQSATRHVAVDTEFDGVEFRAGDTVNCMLAAANRDPAKFAEPDRFDIDRKGLRGHLGFATGPHHCLGANLARLEGRIALERLLARLPGCRVERPEDSRPYGSEFRQPRRLQLAWG